MMMMSDDAEDEDEAEDDVDNDDVDDCTNRSQIWTTLLKEKFHTTVSRGNYQHAFQKRVIPS